MIPSFLEEFPEFCEDAEKDRYWQPNEDYDEPLVHVFFSDILNPFLVEEALVKMDNRPLLARIFTFMEKMAVTLDENVREVLGVTILERLGDDKQILHRARSFMGPNTLLMSHEIEIGWGRE